MERTFAVGALQNTRVCISSLRLLLSLQVATPVWLLASWDFSRQPAALTRWRTMAERVKGGWTWKHVDTTHTRGNNQHAAHQTGQQRDMTLRGARAAFALSVAWLANRQFWLPGAESLCVCCSCAALCAVRRMGCSAYACACSTRALSAVISAAEPCNH